jgi:hypothetical protein
LFQIALVAGHSDIKVVDSIFCGHVKLLSIRCLNVVSATLCDHSPTRPHDGQ